MAYSIQETQIAARMQHSHQQHAQCQAHLIEAYFRIGWVLPCSKGIHLLDYLRNVSTKRAEDNCEISSLQCKAN